MATKKEFEGHTIQIGDYETNMKFLVSGPQFDDKYTSARTFDSYAGACEEILKRMKVAAKQKSSNLALEVLKHDGSGTTQIKGLHARLGTLLFTDGAYSKLASESYGGVNRVYPNVAWIKDLLQERTKLEK